MSRWFRHYAGMMRDDKLVRVSIKTKQSIERVLWVWGAILESAAEIDDSGRFDLDAAEIAYFLRAKEVDILAIMKGLEEARRIGENVITNWGARQFQSDRSKNRVAEYRERKRLEREKSAVTDGGSNNDVTLQERHCNSPDTETETELPLSNDNGAAPENSDAEFWKLAKGYLGGKNPGALIGKWCRDYGRSNTAQAITRAQLERPVERIPFIEGTLKHMVMADEGPTVPL